MTPLHEWQGHRGVTDETISAALGISRQTWVKYRDGKQDPPHSKLIKACNILRVPEEDAVRILCKGYRKC